eukprot:TRINITY_DN6904_c0_g1_i1.p1 TRINITY_DN6904_c0_g1~~TRINITY_DN6904_c0_g1_i1.p1  ORF type:complete len:288 (-),score=45.84 TRINITY_DN6904_c0_g1_i1:26-805(-)
MTLEQVAEIQEELKYYGRYSDYFHMYFPIGMCISCAAIGHKPGSPSCPVPKKKRGGRQTNRIKANRFLFWIRDHFPRFEEIRNKGTVIDIAGGAGALSIAMQLSHRIKCVIIDPRPYVIVDKQQRFYNLQMIPERNPHDTPPEWPEQLTIWFEDDWFENEEYKALWDSADLIVGLHPDQATERMVKFAYETRKPFAVVPCCVFSKLFTNRYLKDGRRVRHHHEFCEYLMETYPGVKQDTITTLRGRNKVLYKWDYSDVE